MSALLPWQNYLRKVWLENIGTPLITIAITGKIDGGIGLANVAEVNFELRCGKEFE